MVVRKRLDLTGPAMVFVTATVVDWTPAFSDHARARQIIEQLRESAAHANVSVCAYVLMPSHLHALLGFPRIEVLSKFMKSLKRDTARRIRDLLTPQLCSALIHEDRHNLWKPKFDDLVVWSEKQFKIKMEYIHNNSVKAGLVRDATEYQYSSARDWMLGEPGPVPIDKAWKWTKNCHA